MNPIRIRSIVVGVLLITATVAAVVASTLDPLLGDPGALMGSQPTAMASGVFWYIVAAVTSLGISVALYPVLSPSHPALALGSVVFRALEAAFYLIAVLCLLVLASAGRRAGVGESDELATWTSFLLAFRDRATLLGVVVFCIGSFQYSWVLLRTKMLPAWLAIGGLVGAVLMATACGLSLWEDRAITTYTPLILPIALQEMVLAVWLLVRGLREQPRTTT